MKDGRRDGRGNLFYLFPLSNNMAGRLEVSHLLFVHQQRRVQKRDAVFTLTMQAIHTKKLEQALHSHERFPINLEWMVDVFKYPNINAYVLSLVMMFTLRPLQIQAYILLDNTPQEALQDEYPHIYL